MKIAADVASTNAESLIILLDELKNIIMQPAVWLSTASQLDTQMFNLGRLFAMAEFDYSRKPFDFPGLGTKCRTIICILWGSLPATNFLCGYLLCEGEGADRPIDRDGAIRPLRVVVLAPVGQPLRRSASGRMPAGLGSRPQREGLHGRFTHLVDLRVDQGLHAVL